jgi:hypothetical protein
MMRGTLVVMMLIAVPTAPSPQRDVIPDDSNATAIIGCIRGSRLVPERGTKNIAADLLRASEFVLEGPKELLQTLRKMHDGHEEEIVGIVKPPATRHPDDSAVQTRKLGDKTRVTVGTHATTRSEEAQEPVHLVVRSYRHVANTCDAR